MTAITRAVRGGTITVLAALALAACSGPANERIAFFAQSGATFAGDAPGVYDYAFRTAVDRESANLAAERTQIAKLPAEKWPPLAEALGKSLDAQDGQLRKRLEYFTLMKRHAGTLKVYFGRLASLAGDDPGEQVATAVGGVAERLVSLKPRVGEVELGGKKLTDLFAPLSKIVVGFVANARLKKHLETYGDDIDEAIGLQQAMFELLLEIEGDRAIIPAQQEVRSALTNVGRDLPADWSDRRRRLFALQLQPSPISAARDAARELRASFRDLSAGGDGALARLQQAIVLVKAVKAVFDNAQ